jgi:outer membrane protein TolC
MKRFLPFALGLFMTGTAWPQTASTNAAPQPAQASALTPDEDREVNSAINAALTSNPDLSAEENALMAKLSAARGAGGQVDPNLKTELHAFNDKLSAAMVKADPKVAPLLAKIAASRSHQP